MRRCDNGVLTTVVMVSHLLSHSLPFLPAEVDMYCDDLT